MERGEGGLGGGRSGDVGGGSLGDSVGGESLGGDHGLLIVEEVGR